MSRKMYLSESVPEKIFQNKFPGEGIMKKVSRIKCPKKIVKK